MKTKLFLCLALILIGGSLFAGLQISMADEGSASQKNQDSQNGAEIRRDIVGTWVACGSFTYTNNLVSFSETLTYAKNGCYSATETIVSDGKTRVEKCQGLWFLRDGLLTYSITNAIGVKPDSEPFFYSKARVIRVNKKQLFLFEGTDRPAFFERRFNCRSTLNPTAGTTAPLRAILSKLNGKVPGLSVATFPANQPYGDNAVVSDYTGFSDKYEITIIAKAYDSVEAAREGQESDSRWISVAADKTDIVQGVKVHEYTRYGGIYFQVGAYTFRFQTTGGRAVLPFLLTVSSALIGEVQQMNFQKESAP